MGNPTSPEPVANLKVFVPRTELTLRQRALWTTAAILAASVVAAALLMGFMVARRMSKPLEALAQAAADVAVGRRDHDVPVPRGNDEVAQLTRAFNQMTHDLSRSEERLRQSERVAAWREIARRIAHEIKNPLSPIQMSIEMLKKVWDRKHPDFEKIFEESTATILEEVGRMKRIVTEFSDFARMPPPRLAPTDLAELVTQVATLLRETAPGVEVRIAAVSDLVVAVDSDQIRQAVMNLVKNALEAVQLDRAGAGGGREPGRVEVRAERDGARGVRIVVTDNGPGMTQETRQKLFTPYYTTKASGTGLGLAIVHRIVEEHEGSIQVDSELGVGTRFVVRLPLRG
jgi:nitrogen fixation/metabolism regulation signal transduction histidine kinase